MKYFLLTGLLMLCGLLGAKPVWAAELHFVADRAEWQLGEIFEVEVIMDTTGVEMNGVEGQIFLPEHLLDIQDIQDGDSSINFWVERPATAEAGVITFSGITPGGFSGSDELLFTLVMRAAANGKGDIGLASGQMLQNDGHGTSQSLSAQSYAFTIVTERESTEAPVGKQADTEPPEDFVPTIATDPNIFAGQKFLVFSTQDKKSGIDHYEVKEGALGQFVTAESPYLLRNQAVEQQITVKAIDNAGNERVVVLEPPRLLSEYQQRALLGAAAVMLGVSLLFAFIWWVLHKRRR